MVVKGLAEVIGKFAMPFGEESLNRTAVLKSALRKVLRLLPWLAKLSSLTALGRKVFEVQKIMQVLKESEVTVFKMCHLGPAARETS